MSNHKEFKKVCVVGLGQVGLPTAEYVKHMGLEVLGYDISDEAVSRAKNKGIDATINFRELPNDIDVYIICVSTLLSEDGKPDLNPVFDASEKIAMKNHRPKLVSIESTIIPGTTRKIYSELFNREIPIVHVPHRYWAGDPIRHGVRQLRVIGAVDDAAMEAALKFYGDILKIPLHIAPSIEVAEMSKVAENAYRYIQIAFAEELRMICEALGIDFFEVREACNTKWNIDMPEAQEGIGGHCLPKDTQYLTGLTEYNILLKSGFMVDKLYREWLSKKKTSKPR